MSFYDKVTYNYIKKIRRWMECPACHKKMTFSKTRKAWICNDCAYAISEQEFLDDFIFWFCDECNCYLNNQEGFDKHSAKHICTNCGFENDTTLDNVKGTCKDCGRTLHNPDASLCDECKAIRKQKAKEWLIKAGKFVGVASVVVGTAYIAAQNSMENNNDNRYTPLPDNDHDDNEYGYNEYDYNEYEYNEYNSDEYNDDENISDYPTCKTCGAEMTEFDGWTWYTCPECGDKVRIIDGTETWYDEIFHPGKNDHYSDFELADFCRGGELSED